MLSRGPAAFFAFAGNAGNGGQGGAGLGGGVYNATGGKFVLTAPSGNTASPPASTFTANQARGGHGGSGFDGGEAHGGLPGAAPDGLYTGNGGDAYGGLGGLGGNGGLGAGGAFYNGGSTSLTGVTADFTLNTATGGDAGSGGNGGDSFGGDSSQDPHVFASPSAPETEARAPAEPAVTAAGRNRGGRRDLQRRGRVPGPHAAAGRPPARPSPGPRTPSRRTPPLPGRAGPPGSARSPIRDWPSVNGGRRFGTGTFLGAGVAGPAGTGVGGGLFLDPAGTATLANTTVSGNHASTSDNDVHGTFKSTA